jgi:hypothetical protein
MIKHAEVLAAIAQGKEIEFKMVYSNIKYEWEVPDNLECINPLSHPHDEWRIKPDSPKKEAWKKISIATTLSVDDHEWAFKSGWHECVDYQYRNGLIDLSDANKLRE